MSAFRKLISQQKPCSQELGPSGSLALLSPTSRTMVWQNGATYSASGHRLGEACEGGNAVTGWWLSRHKTQVQGKAVTAPSRELASHLHTFELCSWQVSSCGMPCPPKHTARDPPRSKLRRPSSLALWCPWTSPGWRGAPDGQGDKDLLFCAERGEGDEPKGSSGLV